MFTNIYEPEDIRRVIQRMKEIAVQVGRETGMNALVIGMPNTGKSSMLNVIRRLATDRKCIPIFCDNVNFLGNAVRTSSQAGLTREVSNVIKVIDDPLVYMSDSPGISFLSHSG